MSEAEKELEGKRSAAMLNDPECVALQGQRDEAQAVFNLAEKRFSAVPPSA